MTDNSKFDEQRGRSTDRPDRSTDYSTETLEKVRLVEYTLISYIHWVASQSMQNLITSSSSIFLLQVKVIVGGEEWSGPDMGDKSLKLH